MSFVLTLMRMKSKERFIFQLVDISGTLIKEDIAGRFITIPYKESHNNISDNHSVTINSLYNNLVSSHPCDCLGEKRI